MKTTFIRILLPAAFVVSLVGTIFSPLLIDGETLTVVKVVSIVAALITGATLSRCEPVKSFLERRSVQLFLFWFNMSAALVAFFVLDGSDQIGAVIGLASVSVVAGIGLLRRGSTRVAKAG